MWLKISRMKSKSIRWAILNAIEVEKISKGDFFINQRKYIQEKVISAKFSNAEPSNIPLGTGYYELVSLKLLECNKQYQKLIDQLLFLSVNIRSNISASISILIRKTLKPNRTDWIEPKPVVRYFGSSNLKLRLSHNQNNEELIGSAMLTGLRINKKENRTADLFFS